MEKAQHPVSRPPIYLFNEILTNYFRPEHRLDVEISASTLLRKPKDMREHLARNSTRYGVLKILIHDIDPWVRQAVTQNRYWQLIGQYLPLLQLPRSEKIQFIQKESLHNLLVFLVHERDPEVLLAVFENPNMSISMLCNYRDNLRQRRLPMEDDPLVSNIEEAIARRKERVFIISKILKARRAGNNLAMLGTISPYLYHQDQIVVKCAINAIGIIPFEDIIAYLQHLSAAENPDGISHMQRWHVLNAFQRWNLLPKRTSCEDKNSAQFADQQFQQMNIAIGKAKQMLLSDCAEQLSNADAFLTMVSGYIDPMLSVRHHVEKILEVEDLFMLMSDDSFPRPLAYEALGLLKQHPNESVHRTIDAIYVQLSHRSHERLKELEASMNACFDIIFNDGILLLERFDPQDTKQQKELLYLLDLILQIRDLPGKMLSEDGYHDEAHSYSDHKDYHRTYLFWRATLGQYLGRLKQFDRLIRSKWIEFIGEEEACAEFREDAAAAMQQLEAEHKELVKCPLKIVCNQCMKRSCASERFASQIDFFLSEMVAYWQDEEIAKNKMPA